MPTVLSKYWRKTCGTFTSACHCNSCTEKRLTIYTNLISDLVKLDYDALELQEHKDFIENIVDDVVQKVGDLYPIFETRHKHRNGSFYQGTKIEEPNEFDFLNPLKFSEHYSINIRQSELSPRCKEVRVADSLRREILSEPALIERRNDDFETELTRNDILYPIQRAIAKALSQLHNEGRLVYKGECDIKLSKIELIKNGDQVDPRKLNLNEVLLDNAFVGPCITLAVGGPICVTHIDLTFCIEDKTPSPSARSERDVEYFVLPKYFKTWMTSYYKHGHIELDDHHGKVLMTLKYCLAECKKYQCKSTYNSHVLKTLVLHHCLSCDNRTSLGTCFYDVACHIFRMGIEEISDQRKHVQISPVWIESLANVGFVQGNLITEADRLQPVDILFTISLYILVMFMKSSPEVLDLLCTKASLSVCLQLICKYSMKVSNIKTDGGEFVIGYNSIVSKEDVNDFIDILRDLRHKGSDITALLCEEPLPYPPYRTDPRNVLSMTLAGTIHQFERYIKKSETSMEEKIRCIRRREEKIRRREETKRWVFENIWREKSHWSEEIGWDQGTNRNHGDHTIV